MLNQKRNINQTLNHLQKQRSNSESPPAAATSPIHKPPPKGNVSQLKQVTRALLHVRMKLPCCRPAFTAVFQIINLTWYRYLRWACDDLEEEFIYTVAQIKKLLWSENWSRYKKTAERRVIQQLFYRITGFWQNLLVCQWNAQKQLTATSTGIAERSVRARSRLPHAAGYLETSPIPSIFRHV